MTLGWRRSDLIDTRSGYSKRSWVENAVYRYQTIIGRWMRSRTLAGQRSEVQIACRVLNSEPCTNAG